MVDISKYFHSFYNNYEEMNEISRVQNILLEKADIELNKFILNQFVVTCDNETISEYEKIFKIPNKGENLEFRRDRILNRLSLSPPFPLEFLRNKLDQLIGKDLYKLYLDYETYTLYLESYSNNQSWFHETYITINEVKPCNIVFINVPKSTHSIAVNEYVECTKRLYHYKLGFWKLGENRFSSVGDKEVLKMPEGKSINSNLLNSLKQHTVDKISYIKLNGSFVIRDFLSKEIQDDKVLVEYIVNKSSEISEITKVELYSEDDSLLSSIDIYVPIIDGLQLKHLINISEVI